MRRSKVSEEQKEAKIAQGGFLLKNNSPNSVNAQNILQISSASPNCHIKQDGKISKDLKKGEPFDETMITPFKIKAKDTNKDVPVDKVIITSNVKKVET